MNKFLTYITVLSASACFLPATEAQEVDGVLYLPGNESKAYWYPEKKVAPVYPRRALQKGKQGCATVGYVVEADGSTSTHRVIAVFPSKIFNASSIKAAKQFVYSPTEGNSDKTPVYVTNTFTFQIGGGDGRREEVQAELSEVCNTAANESLNTDFNDAGAG